ncbi:hypothetical protein J2W17_003658 [Pseudomonas lini]|nr:hypothetical protein [Pseudomonas lini]MDQ0124704.1 hypothetical protein [Pseudomonas lini]
MKNGVPFDRLFECGPLTDYERFAFSILFSEFEGSGIWNWSSMQFDKKE